MYNVQTKIKYGGTALPADSDTETLVDTTNMFTTSVAGAIDRMQLTRVTLSLWNSHSGTLKAYFKENADDTWRQYYEKAVIAAATSTWEDNNALDFYVGRFDNWKLDWTNGGTTQTTFVALIKGIHVERSAVT